MQSEHRRPLALANPHRNCFTSRECCSNNAILNQFVIFSPLISCQSALDIKRFNDGFSLEVLSRSWAAAVAARDDDDDVYVINLMRIIIVLECCYEHYGKGLRKLKLIARTFLIFNCNPWKYLWEHCWVCFVWKHFSAANSVSLF
jgi:hypothetical protein